MRYSLGTVLALLLVLASCGRDLVDVPAAATAERRDLQREQLLVSAAGDAATAAALDRQAERTADPAAAANLRIEAETLRLRAEVSTVKAAVMLQLRDEARVEAQSQRDAIAAQQIAAQQASDRRWAWILAGIGCALSVGGAVVCWRLGLPLWPAGASAAACIALAAFASAAPWLAWILGGAVVLGALALAGWILRRVWVGLRSAYAHGDGIADTVLDVLADAEDSVRERVKTAIGEVKAASRQEQERAGVQRIVASAKPAGSAP